jgi:hypothetical protein
VPGARAERGTHGVPDHLTNCPTSLGRPRLHPPVQSVVDPDRRPQTLRTLASELSIKMPRARRGRVPELRLLAADAAGGAATPGTDRAVQVWDVRSGRELQALVGVHRRTDAQSAWAESRVRRRRPDRSLPVVPPTWSPNSALALAAVPVGPSPDAVAESRDEARVQRGTPSRAQSSAALLRR